MLFYSFTFHRPDIRCRVSVICKSTVIQRRGIIVKSFHETPFWSVKVWFIRVKFCTNDIFVQNIFYLTFIFQRTFWFILQLQGGIFSQIPSVTLFLSYFTMLDKFFVYQQLTLMMLLFKISLGILVLRKWCLSI